MQVGIITVGGRQVGVIVQTAGEVTDTFTPNLEGYIPMGRAAEAPSMGEAGEAPTTHQHNPGGRYPGRRGSHDTGGEAKGHGQHTAPEAGGRADGIYPSPQDHSPPAGTEYQSERRGAPFRQGSAETDRAIVDASRAHDQDPDFMRSVASIESGMNPASNANRPTQYKGLYQMGRSEWQRFGDGGNIYSARDNALGAARMFDANKSQFTKHFGRAPTDTEQYMMHQQGLGFYTRGAMTNIKGNPYPGMHGPQTHESFEAGWGREIARRKAGFSSPKVAGKSKPAFDPETQPL